MTKKEKKAVVTLVAHMPEAASRIILDNIKLRGMGRKSPMGLDALQSDKLRVGDGASATVSARQRSSPKWIAILKTTDESVTSFLKRCFDDFDGEIKK